MADASKPEPSESDAADDPNHGTMAESIEEQAEFEQLLKEKGDWQEAVDAQLRGERPTGEPDPPARA
jgi:hypothetical protein